MSQQDLFNNRELPPQNEEELLSKGLQLPLRDKDLPPIIREGGEELTVHIESELVAVNDGRGIDRFQVNLVTAVLHVNERAELAVEELRISLAAQIGRAHV